MDKNPPPFPPKIGDFDIEERLGMGGMAEVFLAKKPGAEGTHKLLVVKRILPGYGTSRRFKTMFIEEAQLATRLNHPNIVQVYEFFDANEDGHILAMEYVEGCDLGRLMGAAKERGTRIPPWISAFIIAEAAKGLHYAHEKKDDRGQPLEIVHRDVSPQNILLSFEGIVKIADFGVASARLFQEEVGVLKGKYGYMSPEQARGEKADRRSDLYSLGVILWECLAGRPLHGGLGGEALLDIVRSGKVEPPSTYVPNLPEELETIVMKLLSPTKEQRFQTAREFASTVARLLLSKQELIDAGAVEAEIGELIERRARRSHTPAPEAGNEWTSRAQQTQAAAPLAMSGSRSGETAPPDGRDAAPLTRRHEPREVRHVAVVTLRLAAVEDVGDKGPRLQRALEGLRSMLGEMAYKRGMRWVWTADKEARAIAGLTSKPSRAAGDAAWLGLDTHEALAGMVDDLPVPLAAAISIVRGIASGTRDPDGNLVKYILHDPVTYLADVLSESTPLGKTWVAGGVYRLVRREFRWGDAPTLALREDANVTNLPPNIRIYELERSLTREEKELAAAPNDLIGRDADKAELHAAYHAAVSASGGGGQVTCRAVSGELGIGKTALVATFLSELPPNAHLVRVECSPVRQEVPFTALAELVRDAIQATGEEPFEEVVQRIARAGGGAAQGDESNPMVARLAELATNRQQRQRDDEDAHYQRKLIVNGVRQLLCALALVQPLVVVVEGLHWSDKPSLDVLTELSRGADPFPILFVFVTRADERTAPILEGKVRIELTGLSTDEQIRLVETRLGVREGARGICAELLPRVGGNPFYLLEMIDALLERGTLEIQNDTLVRRTDQEITELPSTLEQLLADRIAELPLPEKAITDWLAIAGGPLSIADLAKLSHARDDDVTARLSARGLCDRKGDVLDFRHPLTRDVAYATLDPRERVRMHRELGELLAQSSLARGLSAAIVARHLARGEAGERAATFYMEAANAARNGYQTQLAIRYYQRALSHMGPRDPRRLEIHDALENTFRTLGRRRERVKHLTALRNVVRALPGPRASCLALLRTARFYLDEGRLQKGLPVARQAANMAHSGVSGGQSAQLEIEAESMVSEFLRELGDVQGALAACDRALAACNPKVNPNVPMRVRADVLRSRGVLLRRVGRVREAMDSYIDAIAVFRRVGARRQEARAKNALAYAMFVQGRYEDAIGLALESIQIDLSIGGRFQLAKTLTNIGHAYSRLGDQERAIAYLERARQTHERYGDQDGHADTLVVTAEVFMELGRLDEAEGFLMTARELTTVTNNGYDTTHVNVVSAALARQRRDPKTAIQLALEARRAAEHQALVAYHFYAFAIEAAARVDAGEVHSATLLATTALGAVENLQGCEYGLEIRILCADALKRAASPQAPQARQRAVDYAISLSNSVHEPRFKKKFLERPLVLGLFDNTPAPAPSPSIASNGDDSMRVLPSGAG
jgi:tetratricopeptide (TPR) repeat protein